MPTLLITGGRVIDPASNHDANADVLLVDGKVHAVGENLTSTTTPDATYDARGCLVTPGLIDIHVHLREPGQTHKESIATGAAAAVAGGFTTVCCMPNTNPPLDTPDTLAFIQQRAADADQANVFPVPCATVGRAGDTPVDFDALIHAGGVGFTDDGSAVRNAAAMDAALRFSARAGWTIFQHAEDPELGGGAVNAGPIATQLGVPGWPRVAEELCIQRDLTLCKHLQWQPRYHVQHLTTAEGVDAIRQARRHTQNVTCEASPHHLLLTQDALHAHGTLAKMNPPLREQADVDALIAGIVDGTVTVLATDHAPHTLDEKAKPLADAPFGIVGLECALPLYIQALVTPGHIDWPRLIAMLTINGAELCNLDQPHFGRKGTLAVGADADVTIIDPADAHTIDPSTFVGKSPNCPFAGRQVTGRAIATLVTGTPKLNRDPDRLT